MDRAHDSGRVSNTIGEPRPEERGKNGRWMRAGAADQRAGTAAVRKSAERAGRSPPADPASPPQAASKTQAHARRFAAPYPFDDDQRHLIEQALIDGGIDDASGCAIFIGAIAYEVALLAADLEEPPRQEPPAAPDTTAAEAAAPDAATSEPEPPPEPEPEPAGAAIRTPPPLAPLIQAAEAARQQLQALDADASARLAAALSATDPFARGHGPEYLAAVAGELGRIATAAAKVVPEPSGNRARPPAKETATKSRPATGTASPGVDPSTPAAKPRGRSPAPPKHPDAERFVREAARVYREAFDLSPGTRAADPFPRALTAIAKATGLPIPTRVAALKAALAGTPK